MLRHRQSEVPVPFSESLFGLPDNYPGKIDGRRGNVEKACRATMAAD